eukprot:m.1605691 g.1605691  ORF g.1605691 m.1605691 type:complete len:146 (-) comp25359_c0_seq7:10467-10904(-)
MLFLSGFVFWHVVKLCRRSRNRIFSSESRSRRYDHIKHSILNLHILPEGKPLHFLSSICAGFIAVGVTNPVDVVKTRIMNQAVARDGLGMSYRSPIQCFFTVVTTEGVRGLYKGFFPSWLRLGPHTVVTFLVMEQLRAWAGMRAI